MIAHTHKQTGMNLAKAVLWLSKAVRPGLVLQTSKKNPRVRRWMSTEVEAQPTERVRHPEATGQARAVARVQPEAARAAIQERMEAAAKPLPSDVAEAPVVAPEGEPRPGGKVGKLIAGLEVLEAKKAWLDEELNRTWKEHRAKIAPLLKQVTAIANRESELKSLGTLMDEQRAELRAVTLQMSSAQVELERIFAETRETANQLSRLLVAHESQMRAVLRVPKSLRGIHAGVGDTWQNYPSGYNRPSQTKFAAHMEHWQHTIMDVCHLISDGAISKQWRHLSLRIALAGRPYYDPGSETIYANLDSPDRHLAHEFGHWVENHSDEIRQKARAFLQRRTQGEELQPLRVLDKERACYRPDEMARPDRFMEAYMGKAYSSGDTEIISMGLEFLYVRPLEFARKDPEYFAFMIDVLQSKED